MQYDCLVKWTDIEGVETDIRDLIDVRLTINKQAESDSAEITLPYRNYTVDGDVVFENGEGFKIYIKNDGLIDATNPLDSDLIFTAILSDVERQISSGQIKLICTNLTYNLLSSLYAKTETAKANEIVELIVQTASQNGITQNSTVTNIQQLKSDGSDFEDIEYAATWSSSYDCINDLSGIDYTGDKQDYIFWFDPDGTFNWIYPTFDDEELELTYNEGVKEIKHTKNDVETVAMVIYNAGEDLNGASTYGFKYNEFAETIQGAVKYYPMLDISSSLRATGTITDNSEFIAEQIRQADARADKIIKKYSGGVDKTICELTGRRVNIAKLHKVSSPMFPQKSLRLNRVIHSFNRNGWSTRLELEEDALYTED